MLLITADVDVHQELLYLSTNDVAAHTQNDHSTEAHEIKNYKHQVIQNYAGDWQRYFIDFRNENSLKLNQISNQN